MFKPNRMRGCAPVLAVTIASGCVWFTAPASAAAPPVDGVQQRLSQLQNQAQATSNDRQLAVMAAQAAAIEAQEDRIVAARTADIESLDAKLKPLLAKRRRPSAAERELMSELLAQQAAFRADLAQAQSLDAAANTTSTLIAARRREGFSARLLQRSPSPLSPPFWTSLAGAAAVDAARLQTMAREAGAVAASAPEPRGLFALAFGLCVALALLFPVRRLLERLGRARISGGQFARTAQALWQAAVDSGAPALAAIALRMSAEWGGLLSEKADALASAGVVTVAWGAAILALGRSLVTDETSDGRLIAVTSTSARRLGRLLWAVAFVTGAGFLVSRLNYLVAASVAATIATNCVLSLAYAGIAALILLGFRAGSVFDGRQGDSGEAVRSPVWTLVSLSLSLAVVVTVGAVFAGYTTLAAVISGQIFWLAVLAAATFLLLRFVDDLCGMLFDTHGWAARALAGLFTLHRSTIAQVGVLISAALQLLILIGALTLALTPFGRSGELLFAHVGSVGHAIHIGSAVISPSAIASGLAALMVGLGLVHLLRGWINRRYLPATDWDAGLRNSVSTGAGYIGVAIAVLCALSATGLGFAQIALVASALSVGIGFGLQQIVQNFVSGVILLIERPVKVGDWVNVDGVEGDVRRIRVRATEIQTFDRSTVIIPNSDLITKQVRNKTLGETISRIQLQVTIANPAQARRASDLILETARGVSAVLADPWPCVYIDSLAAGGAVNFTCHVFVASPRDSLRVRSDLYFAILEAFQKAGVALVGAASA